jgi:hypothetical protein
METGFDGKVTGATLTMFGRFSLPVFGEGQGGVLAFHKRPAGAPPPALPEAGEGEALTASR